MKVNERGKKSERRYLIRRMTALLMAVVVLVTAVPMETRAAVAVNDSSLTVTNLGYRPGGILTDDSGNVYVKNCDNYTTGKGQIYKYDSRGALVTSFGTGGRTTFPATNRGVGLSFAPDGQLITTCYDRNIYKVNRETGDVMASVRISDTPYCSVLYNGYIYVIASTNSSTQKIYVFDNDLKQVSKTDLGTVGDGTITVKDGYYGLAIASVDGVERLYTTDFGNCAYGYIKVGSTWKPDSSFGSGGKVEYCGKYAGGLFYNQQDQKVYGCSEGDEKIYNFNPDGTNVNVVMEGGGPNNVYISDSSYAVPFFGSYSFQVFYRPSKELNKEDFSIELLNTVTEGSRKALQIKVKNSQPTNRTYRVRAELIDEKGDVVEARCDEKLLQLGQAVLEVIPNNNWRAGQYKIQMIISSKAGSFTISETMLLEEKIPVGLYQVMFQKPQNGSLESLDPIFVKQADGGAMVTRWVKPSEDYLVDVSGTVIRPEGNSAKVTVGDEGTGDKKGWYPVTITNITGDIQVSVAFKMDPAALQKKKDEAIKDLAAAFAQYKSENYFGDNWEKLLGVKNDGASSIQNASSLSEIQTALVNAEKAMAAVPTKETDSERNQLMDTAIKDINAEYDKYTAIKDSYSEEQWQKITEAKDKALTAIKDANSEVQINAALSQGKSEMKDVPTKEQEKLNTSKETAKNDLNAVTVTESEYTADQLAEINQKKQELQFAIENAAAESDLEGKTDEFKNFLDKYLTKTDREKLIQEVMDAFNTYDKKDYTEANFAALEGKKDIGVSTIKAALSKADAEAAKQAAIDGMKGIPTKADEQQTNFAIVEGIFKESMKAFEKTDYTPEKWADIEALYNKALEDIKKEAAQADMLKVMNTALEEIRKVETKTETLQALKDMAIVELGTLHQNIKKDEALYSTEALEAAKKAYEDGKAAVNAADTDAEIDRAKADAKAAFDAIKPIKITMAVQAVAFDDEVYGYTNQAAKPIRISAELEGCSTVTVEKVELPSDSRFILTETGTGHTVTAGVSSTDWSIKPKTGLESGSYSEEITVTYHSENKARGTAQGTVTMTVVNAPQTMPDNLTVTHQMQAGSNDGSIVGVKVGMEYKKEGENTYTAITADGSLEQLEPGTYLVRWAEKPNYNASEANTYIIKAVRTETPKGTTEAESGLGKNDGKIKITGAAAEAEYRKDGESSYTSCQNGTGDFEIPGLSAGVYYVRYQDNKTHLASNEARFEVGSIEVTMAVQEVSFGETAYGYSVPEAKAVSISAELKGCSAVTIEKVELPSDSKFSLSVTGTDHTVTAGASNDDWSIKPITGLTPGSYSEKITVTYNCENRVWGTAEGTVSMTVVNASQTMPDNLTVTHQTEAGSNDGSIVGVKAGMEYRKEGESAYTAITADGSLEQLEPGTYFVRWAEKPNYNASEANTYIIKAVRTETLKGTTEAESGLGKNDGKIKITNAAAEAEYRKDGALSYTPCENGMGDFEITGLSAGVYYVRYRGNETYLTGRDTRFVVGRTSYSFTCKFDENLGNVTAADGSEIPASIEANGRLEISIEAAPGYELRSMADITINKANIERKEAGKNIFIIKDAISDVTMTVTFRKTAEKEELDKTKDSILASMSNAVKEEIEASPEYADQIKDLHQQLEDKVENAADMSVVQEAYKEFQDSLTSIRQEAMEAMKDKYASPSNAILGDRTEEEYSKSNWSKLEKLVEDAEKLLQEAMTPKELDEGMKKLQEEALKIPTLEDESTEAKKQLAEKKAEALSQLATPSEAVKPNEKEDYTPEAWKTILELIEEARREIKSESTATMDAVDHILEKLYEAVFKIPTMEEERMRNLAALDAGYQLYDSKDYTDENWAVLNRYYELAKEAIEKAETTKDMEALVKDALKQMKSVATLADMGTETKKEPQVVLTEYLIDKLPSGNSSMTKLEEAREDIAAAKEEYDSLTKDQLDQLEQEKLDKLEKLISRLMEVKLTIEDTDDLGIKAEDIAGLLVTPEEIRNASSVELILKVTVKEGDDSEKEMVSNAMAEGNQIGTYLDITLEKRIDGNSEWISEVIQPMEIRLTIPMQLRGQKSYQVICLYEDTAEVLSARQDGNVLTFNTNKFSTYALCYEKKPSSGGGSSSGGGGSVGGRRSSGGTQSITGSWQKDEIGWKFVRTDGTMPVNEWQYINNKWYHFGQNSYMQCGWILVNQVWYYLRAEGDMATGWVLDQNKWYFMDTNGAMYANRWLQYGNSWYYLGADGAMLAGCWLEYNQDWYYLGADGIMVTNATVEGRYIDRTGKRVQ